MRSILRAQKNVLEQKPTKALAPTGFLWKPSRRIGGAAVTVCYAKYGRIPSILFLS